MAKILVVEDSETTRFLLNKVLTFFKHDVILAVDALEALLLLESHPDIDLIITDLLMPRMSGQEFIRQVRAQESLKNLPIMVVSTEATRLTEAEGVQAVVQKPFSPSDLNQTILNVLAKRSTPT